MEFETDENNGQNTNNEGKHEEKYHLIVKLVPDLTVAGTREMVLMERLDQTELYSYTHLFPDLIREIPELKKYLCQSYYALVQEENLEEGIPYASVLVMKDMKPEGYSIIPFGKGYESSLFEEGLDFTARLHVGSRCLERSGGGKGSLPQMYPWISKWFVPIEQQKTGYVPQIYSFFDEGFEASFKALAENSKDPQKYISAYKELELHAKPIYQLILKAGQLLPCGIHGDLWSPNILINENGKDSRMKVIDWQFYGYADPAFDLAIYIMTILPLEQLTPTNIANAVRTYYSLYTDLCKSKDLEIDRSFEEFEQFFNTYGLAYYLYVLFPGSHLLGTMEGGIPKIVRLLELHVEMDVVKFLLTIKNQK